MNSSRSNRQIVAQLRGQLIDVEKSQKCRLGEGGAERLMVLL